MLKAKNKEIVGIFTRIKMVNDFKYFILYRCEFLRIYEEGYLYAYDYAILLGIKER